MSPHIWWYVSRASGIVAWSLLTATVMWGIWLAVRRPRTRPRPAWILDLHRWLGGLAVSFTALHLIGVLADGFVDFRMVDILVPFASTWHPWAVAWGVAAFYVLVAVEATSLAMNHLPRERWHLIHLSSYALFWVATIHMLVAGTDTGSWPLAVVAVVGALAVAAGSLRRRQLPSDVKLSTVARSSRADTWM